MYVQHVKAHVVQLVLSHNHVEHVVAQVWKQLKPDRFLCVLLVERVMVDVKQSLNHVMNVQEKEKRYRKNLQQYQFQLVKISLERNFSQIFLF
jgi:hypothetical protein